jgi:hypothetical protein
MIAKLLKEAEEEATQKAFCDAEMGKSKTSQEEKTMTLDKLQARIDGATSTISENTEAIKTLEAEVAAIDKAQAEATAIRTTEKRTTLWPPKISRTPQRQLPKPLRFSRTSTKDPLYS